MREERGKWWGSHDARRVAEIIAQIGSHKNPATLDWVEHALQYPWSPMGHPEMLEARRFDQVFRGPLNIGEVLALTVDDEGQPWTIGWESSTRPRSGDGGDNSIEYLDAVVCSAGGVRIRIPEYAHVHVGGAVSSISHGCDMINARPPRFLGFRDGNPIIALEPTELTVTGNGAKLPDKTPDLLKSALYAGSDLVSEDVHGASLLPDGTLVYWTEEDQQIMVTIDRPGADLEQISSRYGYRRFRLGNDGKIWGLYYSSRDGGYHVYRLTDGEALFRDDHEGPCLDVVREGDRAFPITSWRDGERHRQFCIGGWTRLADGREAFKSLRRKHHKQCVVAGKAFGPAFDLVSRPFQHPKHGPGECYWALMQVKKNDTASTHLFLIQVPPLDE